MKISSAVDGTRNTLFFNRLDTAEQALISDFDKKLVIHRNLRVAKKKLLRAILHPGNKKIIFVIGPAGVGKTTLLEITDKILWELALQDPDWSPGRIPTAKVEMKIIGGKPFDWLIYLIESLEAFHEPLIDKKKRLKYSELFPAQDPRIPKPTLKAKGARYDDLGNLWIANDARLNGLYFSLVNTLHYRQPYCFLNDEAHHLTAVSGAISLLMQMNAIKSLANASGAVLAFFGIYDMHILLHLNDQLSRRTREIEFARYDAHIKADMRCFKKLLSDFLKALPIPIERNFDPTENALYFFERTCGVPGILKDWLVDALVHAFYEKSLDRFLESCIETAPSDKDVISRTTTVLSGEQAYRASPKELELARARLGVHDEEIKPPQAKPNRSRQRVGLPSPRHYPVGSGDRT